MATARERLGFTLIELLVVISIIAVLIALLLPALGVNKSEARAVICMGQLQQWAVAMNVYGNDHDGLLMRPDMGGTGANLWDVSNEFYTVFRENYNLPHEIFFCTETPRSFLEDGPNGYNRFGSFKLLGYNLWLRRANGGRMIPPHPDDGGAPRGGRDGGRGGASDGGLPFTTGFIGGPTRLEDPVAPHNPVMADLLGTQSWGPIDANLATQPMEETGLSTNSNHQRDGKLRTMNQAFAAGHVERVPGQDVKYRYSGNWHNWR